MSLKEFLSCEVNRWHGIGYGYGYGYGDGRGDGAGYGYGHWYGCGYGYGDVYGDACSDGSGYCSGMFTLTDVELYPNIDEAAASALTLESCEPGLHAPRFEGSSG